MNNKPIHRKVSIVEFDKGLNIKGVTCIFVGPFTLDVDFRHKFRSLSKGYKGERPKSGGAMNHEMFIVLNNRSFNCIGLRGDVSGWMNVLDNYSYNNGVKIWKLNAENIELICGKDGETINVSLGEFYRD